MPEDQEFEFLQALPCTEPDGNKIVEGTGWTAHTIMLEDTGQCPWCGKESTV